MSRASRHQPVLLEESVSMLGVGPGALVVDGTVGDGGHAEAILERIAPKGRLLGLDLDEDALAETERRLRGFGDRLILVRASFRHLDRVLHRRRISKIDALLLDLGMSTRQLEQPSRGFRFARETAEETPLDMRMDRRQAATAADLLRDAPESSLVDWFRHYGELPGARRLARAIVAARRERPLRTAADLLRIVRDSGVGRGRRHHPATLVFQALRMAVNDEVAALEEGLEVGTRVLAPAGRIVVISYHSIEDRIVKKAFRALERGCVCPPEVPVCVCGRMPRLRRLTRRPRRPSEPEIRENPKARSARLRAAERLADAA